MGSYNRIQMKQNINYLKKNKKTAEILFESMYEEGEEMIQANGESLDFENLRAQLLSINKINYKISKGKIDNLPRSVEISV